MTEPSVLRDHLAVATETVTSVGTVGVDAAALPFARVGVTLVHVCGRKRKATAEGRRKRDQNWRQEPYSSTDFPKLGL